MTVEDEVFERYSANFKKLVGYGFKENKGKFIFEKLFKDNEFKLKIIILQNGVIQSKVYEVENNEEFLPLKVKGQQGAFVGEVREEYKKILTDIRNNCFSKTYFIYPQSNRIAAEIISKYDDNPDFMWKKFPYYGVFKNKQNNKWYGIIMNIDYSKLGKENNKPVEIINLKLDKDKIKKLLEQTGFYPAWHMNKKYWITVTLDETVPDKTILELVEESYSYTIKPKKEYKVL